MAAFADTTHEFMTIPHTYSDCLAIKPASRQNRLFHNVIFDKRDAPDVASTLFRPSPVVVITIHYGADCSYLGDYVSIQSSKVPSTREELDELVSLQWLRKRGWQGPSLRSIAVRSSIHYLIGDTYNLNI